MPGLATSVIAVEFEPNTKFVLDANGTEFDMTYQGIDEHGHRFVSEKGTLWIGRRTGNRARHLDQINKL